MRSIPSGFNGDSASAYARESWQLDLRPSQPFACRLYVKALHSSNGLRGTPVEGVHRLMAGWSRRVARRDHFLTNRMSS